MKTQVMKATFMICCMLFNVTIFAQNSSESQSELKGNWVYSAPDAPYGYQDGIIEFKNVDGKLTATVKINGSSYTIKTVSKNENQYTGSLYVDGNDVDITLIPDANKITGTAVVSGWEIPVTLTPQKE